jgi:hypothetical protein
MQDIQLPTIRVGNIPGFSVLMKIHVGACGSMGYRLSGESRYPLRA